MPVTAVLLLCPTDDRERRLHHDLAAQPVPVTVATTTHARLWTADSPAEAVWTHTGDSARLVRLIDLAGG